MNFDVLIERFKKYFANFDELENWIRFNNSLTSIEKLGVKDFIDKSIELSIAREPIGLKM